MKKWLCLSFIFLMLVACTSTNKTEQEIAKVKTDTQFALFHDVLFTASPNDLPKLKSEFPYMFPKQMPDELVLERMKDTSQQFLYKEVKKVYGDFKPQEKEIDELFKHIKYYFKDFKTPTVVTDITGVSYQDRVLYADTLLLVSLDMFLGKENEVYGGYAKYLSETFTPKHMTSAIAQKIIDNKYPFNKNRTFLGQMIFEGKKMYLLDLFLPNVNDEIKLGYTTKKLAWAKLNEVTVWAFFIKNELLYSNDSKLRQRFLEVAPFSKFYTSIDRDSPGAIAKYTGLQIVRAYMKKNQVSAKELIDLDAQTILNQSGYKPKK
ncbi:gliding motility lipoprotein GldB [Wenyingzhuangia sp. chi5]|uniref:Gliding motility lipoprotein GldB n=1 Tax=Wenyingzhuangia gilva TaxID=3057677 RepID=A0ABT8VQA8_9FLAO|nr:gliding motility lipoprotein GldB [Wenyingzhuangia sp. chi5]MDO3694154.1 gliding motility lipoprotein GldB [Wenyingzhuangia sp. chi5]